MASIGDPTPLGRQLKLTNYAESFESFYHVQRISFVVTILDEVDDVGNPFEKLSEEDQQVLNWQASPENLQNDVEVRDTLTQQSGKLCPYKNISTTLYDKVKSDEATLQRKLGNHPLSAYEQISFRSAMLTKHSGGDGQADGQPELLALHDGLGGERSFLRWRSHDYIKVTLCKPRKFFKVFWLIQWDIVGELRDMGSPDDAEPATHQGIGVRLSLSHHDSMMRPGTDSEKFHNVRFGEKRKSPWIAEVRRKGDRKKIWLGSYRTPEAAARAADVGNYYYDHSDKLNFRDSIQYLVQLPLVLSDKQKEEFVVKEARRLAELTEMLPIVLPSTWDADKRTSYNASPADNSIQLATAHATLEGFPGSDVEVLELVQDSVRDSHFTNLDVQRASTSYNGVQLLRESGGSSPDNLGSLWLSTPNVSPVRIGSSQEDTNPLFNYTSSLWGENLTPNSSRDMVARESSPSEIWAEAPAVAGFDEISGHWSLFQ